MRNLIKYCILAMGLVGSNYPMKADVMTVARSFSSHNLNHHTMQEIWKDIPNYEGLYQASNLGNIKALKIIRLTKCGQNRNIKEKIMKGYPTTRGYLHLGLVKNGIRTTFNIHQLVAITFLYHEPCGAKLVVDHINRNQLDNSVDNLRIVTSRENAWNTDRRKSSKYVGVSWRPDCNKWKATIYIKPKYKHLGYFTNELDAHNAYQSELKITN